MSEPLTTEIRVEGAEEAKATLSDFFGIYREGVGDLEVVNTAMREQAGHIYGARRALMLMRTEWRMQHAAWIEGARVMRDIGRIGRNITQMWQAYTIGMMRVESAQRDVRKTTLEVAEAQELYNRYLHDFGEESIYTEWALDALTKATEAEIEASERLKKAQDALIIGYIGIGLQAGDIIATIPMMIMHLIMLKQTLAASGGLTAAVTAFGVSLKEAGVAMVNFLAPIAPALATISPMFAALLLPDIFGLGAAGARAAGREPMTEEERRAMIALPTVEPYTEELAPPTPEEGAAMRKDWTDWFWKTLIEPIIGGGGQFGIPNVPETGLYLLHRDEEVLPSVWRGRGGGRQGGIVVRSVNITNYFGDVASGIDLERAGERNYRAFIRRLEDQW